MRDVPLLVSIDLPRLGGAYLVSPLVIAHRIDDVVHVDSRDSDPSADEPVSGWAASITALSPYVVDGGRRITWRAHIDEIWIEDGTTDVWLVRAGRRLATDVPAISSEAAAWSIMECTILHHLGLPSAPFCDLLPAHLAAIGWLERLFPSDPGDD